MKFTKNFFQQLLRNLLSLIFILVLYYIATWHTGCPIKYLLGIACPGCGMTRACLAVLRLDFATAFSYHPLFLFGPLTIMVVLFHPWIDFKKWRWLGILLVILYLGVYLLRLFLFPDKIVNLDVSDGLIFKSICMFFI